VPSLLATIFIVTLPEASNRPTRGQDLLQQCIRSTLQKFHANASHGLGLLRAPPAANRLPNQQ
jgi:hypothetical protein